MSYNKTNTSLIRNVLVIAGGFMDELAKRLQYEREKLDQMVDEALKYGAPLSGKHDIIKQCKKIHVLIMEFETASEEKRE